MDFRLFPGTPATGVRKSLTGYIFEIETHGEMTNHLAREYPERSRCLLRAYAFDTLNEKAHVQVMEWLEVEELTDIVFVSQ
jgi:hypothetical protein